MTGGDPFDFGTAFEPERPRPAIQPPPPPPAPRSAPPTQNRQPSALLDTTRRGQKLSWASLVVAIVSATLTGFGIYLALDAIAISVVRPLRDAQELASLVVLGLCLGLLALAGGVVSMVRARPRTVATSALVAALVLPLIAAIVGAKFGMDSLVDHVLEKGATLRDDTAVALAQSMNDNHFDLTALVQLLIHLMRG